LNQDTGTVQATQFGVKKEVCEGVKEVLSTGKVKEGKNKIIPFCNE